MIIKVWLPVFAHPVLYQLCINILDTLHQNTEYRIGLVFTGIAHHYNSVPNGQLELSSRAATNVVF